MMASDVEGLVERAKHGDQLANLQLWAEDMRERGGSSNSRAANAFESAAATITALQADVERLRGLLREARPKIGRPNPSNFRFGEDLRDAWDEHAAFLARIDKELNHEG